jgi:hypothetical protein
MAWRRRWWAALIRAHLQAIATRPSALGEHDAALDSFLALSTIGR